jgi:hypothetical protein
MSPDTLDTFVNQTKICGYLTNSGWEINWKKVWTTYRMNSPLIVFWRNFYIVISLFKSFILCQKYLVPF